MHLLYVLIDPRTDEIRYVGITSRSLEARAWAHSKDTKRSMKVSWLKSLRAAGYDFEIRVIETHVSRDALIASEIWWIAHLRVAGHRLTNHTAGGEGRTGSASPRTPEWNRKISESLTGRHPMRRPHSAETRAKISEAALKRAPGGGFTGRRWTPEMKAKASASQKARWAARQVDIQPGREQDTVTTSRSQGSNHD